MSKKQTLVINFANRRVLLETIASYWPWSTREVHEATRYGIAYLLRSGEKVDAYGNDELSRNKAIAFLDKHYPITKFTAQKCAVCVRDGKDCSSTYSCYSYNNFEGFKRKEENESSTKNVHQKQS